MGEISKSSSLENEETEFCDETSVLLKVAGLYASHLMSDIILVVGENRYPAHRVILSASSEVFQCMLMNPQWTECNKSVINLMEDNQCIEVFPQFLKYLYTGQVKISIEMALPLLSLADKYNIRDLVALCRDYMSKSIARAGTCGYLISWLQYTLSWHQQVANELKNFLRLNLETVSKTKDFVELDPNNLCILLQQNDLVVKNEGALFDIVEQWLMQKKEQIENEESLTDEDKNNHLKSLIEGICIYIRYPMMTVEELASIPLKPITSLCKEFFCDKMALGMSFHANQSVNCLSNGDFLQYTPRLYTSDNFCLEMRVPEIHKVENYATFGACFFSLVDFPYTESSDDNTVQWEIDFFPRGIRYNRAQLINVYYLPNSATPRCEVPEAILKTVRVRCTCKSIREEIRFKIAVLVSGIQNNIVYIKTIHTRIDYFSRENRVVNFDNLIPYEELDTENSAYLVGNGKDTMRVHVIILPFPQSITHDAPSFDDLK